MKLNEISKQLADLFNLPLMTGVFPSVLNTAKVVPVFKKDSKLDYSNYRPILCIRDYIRFSITIILSITYSLGLDNNILHLVP